MEIVLLILLAIVAFGVLGVSGSLRLLAEHHKRFLPPEAEPGERIVEGDTLIVKAFSYEQACSVKQVERHADGYLVVAVEPVGSSRS